MCNGEHVFQHCQTHLSLINWVANSEGKIFFQHNIFHLNLNISIEIQLRKFSILQSLSQSIVDD